MQFNECMEVYYIRLTINMLTIYSYRTEFVNLPPPPGIITREYRMHVQSLMYKSL